MARKGALPRHIRPILQIRPGREIPSLTRQNNSAHFGHFVESIEDARDLIAKGAVLRIHGRARDHHGCDVISDADLERLQIGKGVHWLLQFDIAGAHHLAPARAAFTDGLGEFIGRAANKRTTLCGKGLARFRVIQRRHHGIAQ